MYICEYNVNNILVKIFPNLVCSRMCFSQESILNLELFAQYNSRYAITARFEMYAYIFDR